MWLFHANGRFKSSEKGSRQRQALQIQGDGDDWPAAARTYKDFIVSLPEVWQVSEPVNQNNRHPVIPSLYLKLVFPEKSAYRFHFEKFRHRPDSIHDGHCHVAPPTMPVPRNSPITVGILSSLLHPPNPYYIRSSKRRTVCGKNRDNQTHRSIVTLPKTIQTFPLPSHPRIQSERSKL